MKVCVLGDSHSGCFKRAWDQIGPSNPGVTLTFFCDRRWGLQGMHPKDGLLVPDNPRLRAAIEHTSGGLAAVNFNDYDVTLIIGFMRLYPKGENRASKAVLRQIVLNKAKNSVAAVLADRVRQLSSLPIFVAAKPLLASDSASTDPGDTQAYSDIVAAVNEQVFKPLDTKVIGQPAETIVDSFRTRADLAVGSQPLDTGTPTGAHADGDLTHMNTAYGEIFLRACLDAMAMSEPVRGSTAA